MLKFDDFSDAKIFESFVLDEYKDTTEARRVAVAGFLNRVGVYADNLGKSFYDLKHDELIQMFNNQKLTNGGTFNVYKSILIRLVVWSYRKKHSRAWHPIRAITYNELNNAAKYKERYFPSPDALIDCLKNVYGFYCKYEELYMDSLVFCLLYMGFYPEEIIQLGRDSVNLRLQTISCSERTAYIPLCFVEVVAYCNDHDDKVCGMYGETLLPYLEPEFLVRSTRDISRDTSSKRNRYIDNKVRCWRELSLGLPDDAPYSGKLLDPKSLQKSGAFWNIYTRLGEETDFEKLLPYIVAYCRCEKERPAETKVVARVLYKEYLDWLEFFYDVKPASDGGAKQ